MLRGIEMVDYGGFFGAHLKNIKWRSGGEAAGECPFHEDRKASSRSIATAGFGSATPATSAGPPASSRSGWSRGADGQSPIGRARL